MKTILLLPMIILALHSNAQTGGNFAFPFLDLSYNARMVGLGDDFISVRDADINVGVSNPSMLNSEMQKVLSFNHAMMAGGINYGMVSHGWKLKEIGTMSGFIQYISYGEFERTAVNGLPEGTFSPFEMIAGSGLGRELNPRISVGANLKFIYSQLETYNSFGGAIDLAGTFHNEDKGVIVTAMVKNAGVQFNSYADNGNRAPLPAEFQIASSYKLEHAPFRINVLAHHLNKWDLSYNDPTAQPTVDPLTGDTIPVPKDGFMKKLGRHFSFQLEAFASKNIHLRAGFNFQRRQELMLEQRPGIAGFSFGLGLYFRKFSLDYGFSVFSAAGFNNMLTFSTNLSKWRK